MIISASVFSVGTERRQRLAVVHIGGLEVFDFQADRRRQIVFKGVEMALHAIALSLWAA
jgi:hypothetical protein